MTTNTVSTATLIEHAHGFANRNNINTQDKPYSIKNNIARHGIEVALAGYSSPCIQKVKVKEVKYGKEKLCREHVLVPEKEGLWPKV